ncbi:MAG: L-threonylcarbamoyladenylate synthase [Bacteroidota bacterium]
MTASIGTNLDQAALLLREGRLVAIPTETVYGLAGNALDLSAVSTIFETKNRPTFDPLIIHLPNFAVAKNYVKNVPELAWQLAQNFMPGPLTLLLEKKAIVSDLVTAGSPLVAVRVPKQSLTQQLLEKLNFPLAAPSANPFGYISPTRPEHVFQQLGHKIPYILNGGFCEIGIESTIIGFPDGKATIFRKGGIELEAIEDIIGKVAVKTRSSSNPNAPGMLKSHYAPQKPLLVGDIPTLLTNYTTARVGVLSFYQTYNAPQVISNIRLSEKKFLREAARHFFDAMRQLDAQDLDCILAEYFPEEGLGRALNDKLRRAKFNEESNY